MNTTMTKLDSESAVPDGSQIFEQFEFTGTTDEYFKIWIVNVCLTILTLGIYSAWAKVRTTRYFYGNTHLAGSSFDYLAEPETILKGRVIAAVIFIICLGFTSYSPVFKLVVGFGVLVITPWLVIKSLSFRANNTAYRNIRFNFQGGYPRAMFIFWIIMVFVNIVTSGLAYPWTLNKKQQFIIENSAYGTQQLSFDESTGKYYSAIISTYLIAFVIGMLAVASFKTVNVMSKLSELGGHNTNFMDMFSLVLFALPSIFIFLFIGTSIRTKNMNITFSAIKIDQLSVSSRLKISSMLWLYSTNFIAIIGSCGLLIPWAKIRTYQYRMSTLSIKGMGDLDNFIATSGQNQQALGEEIADIFDVEIGL